MLHRVTYVERPALLTVGKEQRKLPAPEAEDAMTRDFRKLNERVALLDGTLKQKLDEIAGLLKRLPPAT